MSSVGPARLQNADDENEPQTSQQKHWIQEKSNWIFPQAFIDVGVSATNLVVRKWCVSIDERYPKTRGVHG